MLFPLIRLWPVPAPFQAHLVPLNQLLVVLRPERQVQAPCTAPCHLSCSDSLLYLAGGGKDGWPSLVMEPGVPFSTGCFATLTLQERQDQGAEKGQKRYHSVGNISRGVGSGNSSKAKLSNPAPCSYLDPAKVLGTALCSRIHEVPLLEPLLGVCKKIAQEHLTELLFLPSLPAKRTSSAHGPSQARRSQTRRLRPRPRQGKKVGSGRLASQ